MAFLPQVGFAANVPGFDVGKVAVIPKNDWAVAELLAPGTED